MTTTGLNTFSVLCQDWFQEQFSVEKKSKYPPPLQYFSISFRFCIIFACEKSPASRFRVSNFACKHALRSTIFFKAGFLVVLFQPINVLKPLMLLIERCTQLQKELDYVIETLYATTLLRMAHLHRLCNISYVSNV